MIIYPDEKNYKIILFSKQLFSINAYTYGNQVLIYTIVSAVITSVTCNADSDPCSGVDTNSECDTENSQCVCKTGFEVVTGTRCEAG
jgi:hypothetical protein